MPRWDVTKVVMEAKYNYRMAIQEARMIRCNQLQESETAYSEALGENAAVRFTRSTKLHREHVEHMHELEEQALQEENKSCQDFLSACQAVLHHAPQPLKENLSTSYHILLGHLPSSLRSVPFAKTPLSRGTAICNHFSQARTQVVPTAKKAASFARSKGKHIHGQNLLQGLTGRTCQAPKEERLLTGLSP